MLSTPLCLRRIPTTRTPGPSLRLAKVFGFNFVGELVSAHGSQVLSLKNVPKCNALVPKTVCLNVRW